MEKLVNLKINGIAVSVPSGTTILEAAKKAKINIPTLCHLKHINAIGSCRICLVEVKNGRPPVVAACVYPVAENMEVITNSKKIMDMRKRNLELILSTHTRKCLSCYKSTTCKLQALANEYGCDELAYNGSLPERKIDESHPSLVRDTGKCILCKRCKAVCSQVQTVKAIDVNNRGFESYLGCAFGKDIAQTGCVGCGQCTLVCPCGALTEKNDVEKIIQALNDPEKIVVAAPAPSVRVALGEEFGQPIGTRPFVCG
jgi:NADP-reducing hydrogenase subunit HndD